MLKTTSLNLVPPSILSGMFCCQGHRMLLCLFLLVIDFLRSAVLLGTKRQWRRGALSHAWGVRERLTATPRVNESIAASVRESKVKLDRAPPTGGSLPPLLPSAGLDKNSWFLGMCMHARTCAFLQEEGRYFGCSVGGAAVVSWLSWFLRIERSCSLFFLCRVLCCSKHHLTWADSYHGTC